MATPNNDGPPAPSTPREPSFTGDGDGAGENSNTRTRSSTTSTGRLRAASIRFLESNPPSGMWHATGTLLAQAPTPSEIRRGDYSHDGWDGQYQLQRRVSNGSVGGLSRVSSAQTPGSAPTPATLVRSMTSPMDTHHEEDHEEITAPASAKPAGKQTTATTRSSEEDPFSQFIGRGRIQSQSYEPKSKIDTTEGDLAADDDDSLEEIDPRKPVKRKSQLPKKFIDPTGEAVPKPDGITPNEKLTSVPTTTERPDSYLFQAQPSGPNADGVYPNGYKFPPKHTRGEATMIGLKAFWKFTLTPFGFIVVIYGLNIVAWGGMLFLLLIGGGKQFMCFPPGSHGEKDCNDLYSPRRIWIEIDSQILNALFCVTGFGLIPWRFRDLYYLLRFRLQHKTDALRKLAAIHRVWFRLPGSQALSPVTAATAIPDAASNPAIPLPLAKAPDPPLTGIRAPATTLWKLDFVIWAYVLNTFLQAVLSGFMWGLNRFNRPSWSTGLFIALACIIAGLGGLMTFFEGKKIKAVEGIPVAEEERIRDVERDVEEKKKRKIEKEKEKGEEGEE